MTTRFNIPYIDWSEERSGVNVRVLDAVTDPDLTTFYNAVVGVTVAGNQQSDLKVETAKDGTDTGVPNDPNAQREVKWFVSYLDAGGEYGNFEIPCADISLLTNNSDKLDLTVVPGITLKGAIEAIVLSKQGLAVTVQSIKFVGRKT